MLRLILLLLGIFYSPQLSAHLKWFVKKHQQIANVRFEFDGLYGVVLVGAGLFALFCGLLELKTKNTKGKSYRWLYQDFGGSSQRQWQIAAIMFVITLLINSFEGIVLAPNLHPTPEFIPILLLLQAAVCFALILGPRVSGMLILLLLLILMTQQPLMLLIDYLFEFTAIALALLLYEPALKNSKTDGFLSQHRLDLATLVLRLGLGGQLMLLGINNKLLDPGLALAFLHHHSFVIFMPSLGVAGFGDLHFVFAAGVVETLLGLLLLWGIATRVIALVVSFFFTLTAILFGVHELIGHLPVLAITLILICRPNHRLSFVWRSKPFAKVSKC